MGSWSCSSVSPRMVGSSMDRSAYQLPRAWPIIWISRAKVLIRFWLWGHKNVFIFLWYNLGITSIMYESFNIGYWSSVVVNILTILMIELQIDWINLYFYIFIFINWCLSNKYFRVSEAHWFVFCTHKFIQFVYCSTITQTILDIQILLYTFICAILHGTI